jgi:putative ATP-dependent endonuclease of the OLD family
MFVSEITIRNFRSCQQVRVRLRPEVTVLAGENNAGKTTVIDGLRQVTESLDGRRGLVITEQDVFNGGAPEDQVRLDAVLSDIDPDHAGTYREAFLAGATPDGKRSARWSLLYTRPPLDAGEVRRRGRSARAGMCPASLFCAPRFAMFTCLRSVTRSEISVVLAVSVSES